LKRWIDARRNQQYFVSKNAEWLEQEISLHIKDITKPNETDYEMPCTSGTRGRRKLAFEEISGRSKRRKSKELRKTVGFPELAHANEMSVRSDCKMDAAKLFSEGLETTSKRALRIRKAGDAHAKNVVVPYTPKETFSLFTKAHWKESKHTKIRSQAKMKNCNIYPIYHVIKPAKQVCYPPKDKIVIHESLVDVYLQALMDRTASTITKA
jgi:hypothetical protein